MVDARLYRISIVLIKALVLSSLQSQLLDLCLELSQRCEFRLELRRLDLLFAAWALHEGKGDAEGAPFVTQQLLDTLKMELMSTR